MSQGWVEVKVNNHISHSLLDYIETQSFLSFCYSWNLVQLTDLVTSHFIRCLNHHQSDGLKCFKAMLARVRPWWVAPGTCWPWLISLSAVLFRVAITPSGWVRNCLEGRQLFWKMVSFSSVVLWLLSTACASNSEPSHTGHQFSSFSLSQHLFSTFLAQSWGTLPCVQDQHPFSPCTLSVFQQMFLPLLCLKKGIQYEDLLSFSIFQMNRCF